MAEILIKRRVEYCYISGKALRLQRENAGISQRKLADLIKSVTDKNYIEFNGQAVSLNKMTISRMERSWEFGTDYSTAKIIQKILSS